jgi:hypothetical protein
VLKAKLNTADTELSDHAVELIEVLLQYLRHTVIKREIAVYNASDIASEHDFMEYCRERVNTSVTTSLMRVLARGVADPPPAEGADEDAAGVPCKYDKRTAGRIDRLSAVLLTLITELLYKGLRPNTTFAGQLFQAQIASVRGTSVNTHALIGNLCLVRSHCKQRTSGWAKADTRSVLITIFDNVGFRKAGGSGNS